MGRKWVEGFSYRCKKVFAESGVALAICGDFDEADASGEGLL